jgi:hypothetical protein
MDAFRNRSARGRRAQAALTPEEAAEQFLKALEWREIWRAAKAAPAEPVRREAGTPADDAGEEARRRARFAEGLARLEFGRAYWDERKARGRPPGR